MNPTTLHKYYTGHASAQERLEVMQWIAQSPENREEANAIRRRYDMMLWRQEEIQTHINERKQKSWRRPMRLVLQIAGLFALAFISSYMLWTLQMPKEQMQTLNVPPGQCANLTLADGTRVWVNANSTLTYPTSFNTDSRRISLTGEAYFDVTHNKKIPFIVEAKGYEVMVLGTEFDIHAYPEIDYFATSLLEGSVQLSTPSKQSFLLTPNEQVVVNEDKIVKRKIIDREVFKWREGLYVMNNKGMRAHVHDLELFYDVHIDIPDNHPLLEKSYSGKFRISDGVEHVLKVIQIHYPFSYQFSEDRRTIKIR